MSDTTDTTTTNNNPGTLAEATQRQAWLDAAAASAEAQKPDDPPPRYFIEELDVKLSSKEFRDNAVRCEDVRDLIEAFDVETKSIAAGRKAERAKLLAEAKELGTQTRTGRARRKVRCAEYTSFKQNRKYVVRLDRKDSSGNFEEISETPLSHAERQGKLALAEAKPGDGEEGVDEDEDEHGAVSGADENDELDDGDDYEGADGDFDVDDAGPHQDDSTTNITDPAAVAHGSDAPSLFSDPPTIPIKRTRKNKKEV